jgi:hypothetical protein
MAGFLGFLAIASGTVAVIGIFGPPISWSLGHAYNPKDEWDSKEEEQTFLFMKRIRRPAILLAVLFILLSLFLPSSKVLYLIAASEIGEDLVTSPGIVELYEGTLDLFQQRIENALAIPNNEVE